MRKSHIFSDIMIEIMGNYSLQHLHYFSVVATSLVIREVTEQEAKMIPTAGIAVLPRNPNMYLLYNREFTDKLNDKQLRFLFFHEIFHVILMSKSRGELHNHDIMMVNITHDQVINSTILDNYSDHVEPPGKEILTIGRNYKGLRNYESLLQDLEDKVNKAGGLKQWLKEQGIKPLEGVGTDANGNPNGQTFDVHIDPSKLDEVQAEGLNRIEQVANRGLETSNMKELIEGLVPKPRINVVDYIAKYSKAMKGDVRKGTWHRRNRKFPGYIKGRKKESIYFNLILDTSGSMSNDDMTGLLGAVMRNNIFFKLIQIDTQIQDTILIKNQHQLKKAVTEFKGRGGTVLQPALDYCKNNDLEEPMVVLTDGYTDELRFHSRGLVVYTETESPIAIDSAKVTQIQFIPK